MAYPTNGTALSAPITAAEGVADTFANADDKIDALFTAFNALQEDAFAFWVHAVMISPKEIGCAVNGSTDDTAALQAVLDSLGTARKMILLAPGQSIALNGLNLPSNTMVWGPGARIVKTAGATTSSTMLTCIGTSGLRRTNVHVRGPELDGLSGTKAIQFQYVDDWSIRECYIHDTASGGSGASGIWVWYATDGVIDSNRVEGSNVGQANGAILIADASQRIHVTRNKVENSSCDGILVYQTNLQTQPSDITVAFNYVTQCVTTDRDGRGYIHFYRAQRITCIGNFVDGTGYAGAYEPDGIRFRNTRYFTCVGNRVTATKGAGISVVAIQAAQSGETETHVGDGTIAGNQVWGVYQSGIRYAYNNTTGAIAYPCTITGNTVEGVDWAAVTAEAVGINVGNPGSVVVGNNVRNSVGAGMAIFNGVTAVGNAVKACGSGSNGVRAGIRAYGGTAAQPNTLIGNRVNGQINGSEYYFTAGFVAIMGNVGDSSASAYNFDGSYGAVTKVTMYHTGMTQV